MSVHLPRLSSRSHDSSFSAKLVQDQRLKTLDPLEDGIIREETGCAGARGGCRLQRIRSSQAMEGAKARGNICDMQIGCDAVEVGISGKQRIDFIHVLFIGIVAIRLDK